VFAGRQLTPRLMQFVRRAERLLHLRNRSDCCIEPIV
jgi:hypothetical protein